MYTFCLSNKANDLSSTDKQTINSEILGVISLQKLIPILKKHKEIMEQYRNEHKHENKLQRYYTR